MKAQDLILGKCYVYDKDTIVRFQGIKAETKALAMTAENFRDVRYEFSLPDIRLATEEEEHWYDECVRQRRYIDQVTAKASFAKTVNVSVYPAYVKCTSSHTQRFKEGNVYKTYPGLAIKGHVYIKPDENTSDGTLAISDYPLEGGLWSFKPCKGPETSSITAPEAITEVFGKFIIGNIVVSLRTNLPWREEGDIFTVLPKSKQDCLYYKPSTHSQDRDDWRLATTKECQAYHNGVKNIKQMDSSKQTQFLKDEYIVTTKLMVEGSFRTNHVFKQRENHEYLRAYKDCGGTQNGSSTFMFNDPSTWRYATSQEIMEYDFKGMPVDVSRIGMSPKENVEPIKTNTMAPDKWCIEMDYGHPDRLEIMNFINVAWKAGMTGSGGFYYLENGKVKCNTLKPKDYDLMSIPQFKRDIMTSPTQSVPYVFTLTPQWYMLVTEENKYDAEVWRWEGNPGGYELEIGQLIGIPDHGGKSHNPGKATTNFGTQISYLQFKAHVLTKEEKGRLITNAFPVGSCVVVTKGSYGKNGKENHCYKIIEHTGVSNGDISLKYQSCNSIGLSNVRVKRATTDQTARYEREGKPYDTKVSEVSNTVAMTPDGEPIINDPYAGKSLEEMLVICQQMFPKGCKYRKKGDTKVSVLEEELRIQTGGTDQKGISNYGLPWFFFNGTMRVELVSPPDNVLGVNVHKSSGVTTSWSHTKPDKSASDEEILAYCKKMYPIGTIILDTTGKYQYTITEEIFWSAGCFISHNGIPIVYDRSGHYFASIAGHTPKEESSTKTLKDLPKKATLSDVSALVKHQEPVIAFSKKAKRSKLVIINK